MTLKRSLLVAAILLSDTAPADSGRHIGQPVESCDVVEVNHYQNDDGEVVLEQIIFWDHSPGLGRMVVRAWRSLKRPTQLPYVTPAGDYQAAWHDTRDGGLCRVVRARSRVETWTDYDPETVNQELLDRNQRPELAPQPKRAAKK